MIDSTAPMGCTSILDYVATDRFQTLADRLSHLLPGQGFSLDEYDLRPPPPHGFMVAIGSGTYWHSAMVIDQERLAHLLENWYDENAYVDLSHPVTRGNVDGLYFGGWHDPDTGNIMLEFSLHFDSILKALACAQHFHQKSIYDLASNTTIDTKRATP